MEKIIRLEFQTKKDSQPKGFYPFNYRYSERESAIRMAKFCLKDRGYTITEEKYLSNSESENYFYYLIKATKGNRNIRCNIFAEPIF